MFVRHHRLDVPINKSSYFSKHREEYKYISRDFILFYFILTALVHQFASFLSATYFATYHFLQITTVEHVIEYLNRRRESTFETYLCRSFAGELPQIMSSPERTAPVYDFPIEVLEIIFAQLPLTELLTTCSLVSRKWRDVISRPKVIVISSLYNQNKL